MPAPSALHNVTGFLAAAAALSAAIAWARSWITILAHSGLAASSCLLAARLAAALFIPASSSSQLSHLHGPIGHAVGEAPFVVVPRQRTHEALVDHLGLVEIQGGARRVV